MMIRYDKLSRRDAEDEELSSSPTREHTRNSGSRAYKVVYKYINTLLILGLLVGLIFQSVELHRSDNNFQNDLSTLKQSLKEDLITQKLSENTSNAQVLLEVQRLRTELHETEASLRRQGDRSRREVQTSLDNTVQQLDVAVRKAKADIREDVDQVRQDMSSYISSTDLALKAESDFIKFEIAGTFSLLACLISVYNVWCHLRHFAKPSIQRRILAILIIVPVYSLTSWLSLILASAEPFLSAVRDCYEAYIVYTFMAMLIEILGNSNGPNAAMLVLAAQIQRDRQDHLSLAEGTTEAEEGLLMRRGRNGSSGSGDDGVPPLGVTRSSSSSSSSSPSPSLHDIQPPLPLPCPSCCCQPLLSSPCRCSLCSHDPTSPRSIAAAILHQCQMLAMQFVFLKPLLAAFPFFLELCGVPYYDHPLLTQHNHLDWSAPRLYVYLVLNVSVSLAFYGLMKFYYATSAQLAWCDPWPKFLTVKVVVFMTFWQGIAITGMSVLGLVDEQAGMAAQNILICIEMLLASLMHHLFFPYREWQEGYKKEKDEGLRHLRDTLVMRDFVTDVRGVISQQVWQDVPAPARSTASSLDELGAEKRGGLGAALQGSVDWLARRSRSPRDPAVVESGGDSDSSGSKEGSGGLLEQMARDEEEFGL